MALKIAVSTEFGVDASYWNIGANQEDFKGGGREVTLYGYKDKAAREEGRQPLGAIKFTLTGDQYSADEDRATIYQRIKTLGVISTDQNKTDWSHAEDV